MNVHFFCRGNSPKGKSTNRASAGHKLASVNSDFAAVADYDHTPANRQKLQVIREIHIGKHFQNEVQAAPTGGFHNLFLIARFAVIEDLMSPFALHEVE